MENEVNSVVTQQQTGNGTPESNPSVVQPTDNGDKGNSSVDMQQKPDRTFTRDEVTAILKKRIDRYQNSVFNKYGVKDAQELDSLFEKAKGYDDLIKTRDELTEKVAFMGNNINPDKYDDIRTYFKGKGLQFTEDALKQHLETHPEWIKQSVASKPVTTIKPIGTEVSPKKAVGEKEMAEKMFGMSL